MKTVQFAAKFEYLDEIREFVGAIARDGGFSDKDVYNIQLATDEAASNIIEHAYENITDGMLELSCGMRDDLTSGAAGAAAGRRMKRDDANRPFDRILFAGSGAAPARCAIA